MTTAAVGNIDYRDVELDITAPATPLARAWAGHRYGLQALKPCLELVALAQKAYERKPVDSITRTGAGALNIDGGRVAAIANDSNNKDVSSHCEQATSWGNPNAMAKRTDCYSQGRWPPNMALCHSPECTRLEGVRRVKSHSGPASGPTFGKWGTQDIYGDAKGNDNLVPKYHADADGLESVSRYSCTIACPACGCQWTTEERGACPECGEVGEWVCAVRRLGEQSGVLSSAIAKERKVTQKQGQFVKNATTVPGINQHGDTGTAARFYPNPDYHLETAERLAAADSAFYAPKASRRERDAGVANSFLIPRHDLSDEQRMALYAELEQRGVAVTCGE